jgi:hypothetical protein
MTMLNLANIIADLCILVKLLALATYFYAEILLKNFIIPKKCLAKSIKDNLVLITGAGNSGLYV